MIDNKLFQIIDANLNRTREGLRVCEDIARFGLENKNATKSLKTIRHRAIDLVLKSKKISLVQLLSCRDTCTDKAKFIDFRKGTGVDISDIFMSNIERVKESLRVLEECFKLIDEKISRGYRKLRFNAYDVEKNIVKKARLVSRNR
ncbi:MAG: thiamine-phosphate pyrophosphorylase [Candidatus Omnitrophica bacterium CG_4_9_14_0_2_um_filter_42_8]|nr:MAG: thiamine-phosphate pyrophosphorylase [Candidatus Omnitrophica bacterium CG22_combo_CG10-13_8_21_14_all_43_16]PJC49056.1 MAG: thiamine-phosphate pyrophosphorylase [Candidatus Omnitrophica bacterium CG_4_9_14_0_2_um_filter_42_8]